MCSERCLFSPLPSIAGHSVTLGTPQIRPTPRPEHILTFGTAIEAVVAGDLLVYMGYL